MPSFIVKAEPDRDWYCLWSTVVDAPTHWGSRADLKRSVQDPRETADERFDRADKNGTSARIPGTPDAEQWFGWNDEPFVLMESGPELRNEQGYWLLPRANLRAFCAALDEDTDTTPLCSWRQHEEDPA